MAVTMWAISVVRPRFAAGAKRTSATASSPCRQLWQSAILRSPRFSAGRDPDAGDRSALTTAFGGSLSEAEAYLDQIAEEARNEARLFSADPVPLLNLVEQTRQLSAR
jgi:hypothetical protein